MCIRDSSWLEQPLLSVTDIDRRSSAVAALVDDTIRREELIAGMTGLGAVSYTHLGKMKVLA